MSPQMLADEFERSRNLFMALLKEQKVEIASRFKEHKVEIASMFKEHKDENAAALKEYRDEVSRQLREHRKETNQRVDAVKRTMQRYFLAYSLIVLTAFLGTLGTIFLYLLNV